MTLPKPKHKKLINKKQFIKIAKKVQESFKEEAKYLSEKKMNDGHTVFHLMTRDTTDFLQSIFDLTSVVNIPTSKGIFTYGIYQYTK